MFDLNSNIVPPDDDEEFDPWKDLYESGWVIYPEDDDKSDNPSDKVENTDSKDVDNYSKLIEKIKGSFNF